jgi:hypothetical protein
LSADLGSGRVRGVAEELQVLGVGEGTSRLDPQLREADLGQGNVDADDVGGAAGHEGQDPGTATRDTEHPSGLFGQRGELDLRVLVAEAVVEVVEVARALGRHTDVPTPSPLRGVGTPPTDASPAAQRYSKASSNHSVSSS